MINNKNKLAVTIFTNKHKINGKIYIYENSRMSDLLNTENMSKDFLPITDAEVIDLQKKTSQKIKFLSVNKRMIEFVYEN